MDISVGPGLSGDRRAIPALIRLLTEPVADRARSDTRIAALRALARLQAVETRQICLTVAQTDSDPGTRISAIRALLELGYEEAPVETAAKEWIREMLLRFGNLDGHDEPPTLKR